MFAVGCLLVSSLSLVAESLVVVVSSTAVASVVGAVPSPPQTCCCRLFLARQSLLLSLSLRSASWWCVRGSTVSEPPPLPRVPGCHVAVMLSFSRCRRRCYVPRVTGLAAVLSLSQNLLLCPIPVACSLSQSFMSVLSVACRELVDALLPACVFTGASCSSQLLAVLHDIVCRGFACVLLCLLMSLLCCCCSLPCRPLESSSSKTSKISPVSNQL